EDHWQDKFFQTSGNRMSGSERKIPCYATGGPSNYPPEKLIEKVAFYLSLGFRGVKLGAGGYWPDDRFEVSDEPALAADFEAAKASLIRERFGNDLWLMIDA